MVKVIQTLILGEKRKGELLKQPTVRTTQPKIRIPEHKWYEEFRVTSLHRVQQKVFMS